MADITCVLFVNNRERGELRQILNRAELGKLRWREEKHLFGSEFYLTGPSTKTMKVQVLFTGWLAAKRRRTADRERPAASPSRENAALRA